MILCSPSPGSLASERITYWPTGVSTIDKAGVTSVPTLYNIRYIYIWCNIILNIGGQTSSLAAGLDNVSGRGRKSGRKNKDIRKHHHPWLLWPMTRTCSMGLPATKYSAARICIKRKWSFRITSYNTSGIRDTNPEHTLAKNTRCRQEQH